MSKPVSVTITRAEMQEALVLYAAAKSGTKYPLKRHIEINGSLTLMGGDEDEDKFCTVTLEHMPNVTPIGKRKTNE